MEINLKTEQKKLVKNLETIFKAPSMKMAFAQPNMQTIIEKQLNILGFLERTNESKTIKSTNFLTTYNQLSNKHFVIDTNISFNDHATLVDDINYLGIYVKNIYKIDLQALAEGKEAVVVTPTVTDAPQPNNNPMAAMFPFMSGGGSLEQNPMATAMANMRVRQEAAANRVYLYKDKPFIIPILKWIMSIALLLCALASIFVGIGMVTSAGSTFLSHLFSNDDSTGLRVESVMYFIFGILVLFNAYTIMHPLLSRKTKRANDNQYYYFQLRNFFFIGLMFIFVVIFGLATGDRYIFSSSASPWKNNDSTHAFGVWAAYIGYILLLVSFGIAIACVVVASTLNPKIDVERLDALTRQYLDEMTKKGSPPPNQGVAS